MKYMNKRNNKVVELVDLNDKYNTVELREVGQEKTFVCTTSTFKRWYKKLEEPAEVAEPVAQLETEIPESVEEVVDEAPEVKPEKKEKKARAKKQPKDFTDLLQYIDEIAAENGMVPYVREKQPYLRNYRINGEGPVVFLVYTRSKAVLQCKTKLLPETVYEQMKQVDHCFDRQYDITENRQFAETVISSIAVPAKTK